MFRRRAREQSRIATSSSSPLDDWLAALVETPGLTAIHDAAAAHELLLGGSIAGLDLVADRPGPLVDVGSGGGVPGIPLAHALPDMQVVLLEAERRKCAFLERHAPPNARVVWGRAEEQGVDWAGVAVARALAKPPTAAEWCLPLVRAGGVVVLWVGPSADSDGVAAVAERIAGRLVDAPPGYLVIEKTGPTPDGFPRRVGLAKKRPLG